MTQLGFKYFWLVRDVAPLPVRPYYDGCVLFPPGLKPQFDKKGTCG